MVNFDFNRYCYSCGACVNVCNVNAICMDEFLFPHVDNTLCVNCGSCDEVCVKINEKMYETQLNNGARGFVCKNINENERVNSSSGGVFILLAKHILKQGGYVCGCVYDEVFMPTHILSNDIDDVKKMMGSKYVKSDMSFCIREMEQVLKQHKYVLFVGVPCQVAAVRNCLSKYSNLYLVNVVCHGSIERDFWSHQLDAERKMYGNIVDITMRDKSKGWNNYGLRISFENGNKHVTFRNEDGYFLSCFTNGLFERQRCLTCKYKGNAIVGDLLIGDGWGMDKLFPEICDANGVSSVITISEVGMNLLSDVKNKLVLRNIDISLIINNNARIVSPAPIKVFRNIFQKKCRQNPENINYYCKKYANPSICMRAIEKICNTARLHLQT